MEMWEFVYEHTMKKILQFEAQNIFQMKVSLANLVDSASL
jgi:hypothetical protein